MRKIYFLLIAVAVVFASCTAQGRLSSKLGGEWDIEKYESRTQGGSSTSIENAGSINFLSGGRGTQSFTTAIAAGGASSSDFQWDNTTKTVSIKSAQAEYPKVWVIVDSGRNKMTWYSTDSQGNVQVMHLKKK